MRHQNNKKSKFVERKSRCVISKTLVLKNNPSLEWLYFLITFLWENLQDFEAPVDLAVIWQDILFSS